jgi:hypothetical protein
MLLFAWQQTVMPDGPELTESSQTLQVGRDFHKCAHCNLFSAKVGRRNSLAADA